MSSRWPRRNPSRWWCLAGVVGLAAVSLGTPAAAAALSPRVKMTLPRSIPPDPVFLKAGLCGVDGPNDSAACTSAVVKAIDHARTFEPLAAIPGSFNVAAFDRLSNPEQIFAVADIERTARALPPMVGMTAQLDTIAAKGAASQDDPEASLPLRLKTGGLVTTYGSNLAEGTANGIGADYFWMYDDGLGSPNADCTKSHEASCWGHRENILNDWQNKSFCPPGSQIHLLLGAAEVTSKVTYSPSITEIFVNDCGALPTDLVFTWSEVQKLVFGH